MKMTDALESAYKNGYVKGYEDAMRIIQNTTTKPREATINHDETGIEDNH